MPNPNTKSADIAIAKNKEALLEAEDRRLVSSWLKPSLKPTQQSPSISISTSETTTPTQPTDDEEDEDEEDFAAEADEAGVGYSVPKDSSGNPLDRTNLSANDKLRKQMGLGKNTSRYNSKAHSTQSASKPMPQQSRKVPSDDETEGRTRVAASKKVNASTNVTQQPVTNNGEMSNGKAASVKKRPASYLDEMLAKRNAKKNKTTRQEQLPPRKTKKTDEVDD